MRHNHLGFCKIESVTNELSHIIRDEIYRSGPITFERFMEMALYHPEAGYYTRSETEIGCAGDFYTSPHLHPIFGAMLGRQIEEFWQAMGRPGRFDIVEMGTGRGYLCHDILSYLGGREIFDCINYGIVELNPVMAQRQRQLLGSLARGKVRWGSSLAELGHIKGAIISNELIDAFPVHAVIWHEGQLHEIRVAWRDGAFIETLAEPSTPELSAYLEEFSVSLPEGYRTEINLRASRWMDDIAQVLESGFVLTIDYGYPANAYYDSERSSGTLLCYHQHQLVENPYINIGRQDITAHVNFTALVRRGRQKSLNPLGFTRQGIYLVGLGLDEVITELYAGSPSYQSHVSKISGLIMPGAMGDSHKVLVQCKAVDPVPGLRGFSIRNQVQELQ